MRVKAIKELLVLAGGLKSMDEEPTAKQISVFEGISYMSLIRPLIMKERRESEDCTYLYFATKWKIKERAVRYILNKS